MAYIIKKFIGDNEVGAAKIRLESSAALRARNAANSGDIDLLVTDASDNTSLNADNNLYLYALGGFVELGADAGSISMAASTEIFRFASYNAVVAPTMQFEDKNGTKYAGIKAPDVISGTSFTLVLPQGTGTSGQVLSTNGSGELSWVNQSAGPGTSNKETFTLVSGDITNGYIDLAQVAINNTILLLVKGSGSMLEGASDDYTVSYTGGVGGKTRITWVNDLATALAVGDKLQVNYIY